MHPDEKLMAPCCNGCLQALLCFAKMAADFFLLYLAPRKNDYRLFVQSQTPDFDPDGEDERTVLERVLKKKRRKHAQCMGTEDPDPATPAVRGMMTEPLAPAQPSVQRSP